MLKMVIDDRHDRFTLSTSYRLVKVRETHSDSYRAEAARISLLFNSRDHANGVGSLH